MSSLRDKIARLRANFLEQLPARLALARDQLARLRATPGELGLATELHRFLHSVKGTARSFGCRELGQSAAAGEDLAALWLEPGVAVVSEDSLVAMAACLATLEDEWARAQQQGPQTAAEGSGFELPTLADRGLQSGAHLVYVCDDERSQLDQLASQLACFGYRIETFTETRALRSAILARRPDAVIMDINFPEGNNAGTEVLAELRRELGQAVPAVFLSARDDFGARLAAVQAGGEAYFVKPARALELVAVLDTLTRLQQPDPYRILVIDDEPEVAAYHALLLQQAGMLTREVCAPEAVLLALRDFRPDMVLMDMYMPRCSGRDLARLIRQLPDHVGLPIVYLSSETDRHKQFSAMRVGAEGFMTKPVVPDELVAAVAIRAERMRTLRSLMARDSLTGLFNHTTTTQLLENALAAAARRGTSVCFAMIDIDHFKAINDTHGHPVGDQVILALARVLQQRLRHSDVVGRYGGEEFAVIVQEIRLEEACRLIDELREDFARVQFHAGPVQFSCTFSAGVAAFPRHRKVETLREAADRALYEAKRAGRNRVRCSEDEST